MRCKNCDRKLERRTAEWTKKDIAFYFIGGTVLLGLGISHIGTNFSLFIFAIALGILYMFASLGAIHKRVEK